MSCGPIASITPFSVKITYLHIFEKINGFCIFLGCSSAASTSIHKPKMNKPRADLVFSESDSDLPDSSDEDATDSTDNTSLQRFLSAWGLGEYYHL